VQDIRANRNPCQSERSFRKLGLVKRLFQSVSDGRDDIASHSGWSRMSALSSSSLEKHSSTLLTVFCEAEIPEDKFRHSLLKSEMCSDASSVAAPYHRKVC
jgi:hypothetical protein